MLSESDENLVNIFVHVLLYSVAFDGNFVLQLYGYFGHSSDVNLLFSVPWPCGKPE